MIPADKLEIARQRGVAVHKMVELDAKGDLDEDALPEWLVYPLNQWRKFCDDTSFKVLESECRVYHPSYRYAGALDLFGTMSGEAVFLDIKRSFLAGRTIGYQLSAYQEAYCAQNRTGRTAKRYALRLTESGPYRLEPFADKSDIQSFLTCLNWWRLKEKHDI